MIKRGYTYAESLEYLGVKRRFFDENIRPHIPAVKAGTSSVFQRVDLDRAWEQYVGRNERPGLELEETKWVAKPSPESSGTSGTDAGKSTSKSTVLVFENVADRILKRRKAG